MKKITYTLLACLIFSVLAAGSMNDDKEDTTSNTKSASATSKSNTDSTTEKTKEYFIGDTVSVGHFATAIHTPEVKSSVGNEFLQQEANGEYWVIPVSVRNDDKQARMVTTNMFKLVSSDGTTYDPDSTAVMYMDSKNKFFLDNINPGVQVDGYIVFDMPKRSKISKYALEVDDVFNFGSNSKETIKLTKK